MKLFTHICLLLTTGIWCASCGLESSLAAAQEPAGAGPLAADPDLGFSQDELRRLAAESADEQAPAISEEPTDLTRGSINFLKLLLEGGVLMIPIGLMSLLVVTVFLERLISLRNARVFPRRLRRDLQRAIADTDVASPQQLFETSQQYPSAAARILQDVLQKVGRPIPEMEMAINEGTEREADTLYSNVRWLTLAAAVTPLIGLLGTVWGMIIAFYNTTQLGAGSNKAEYLAEGIYIALVTTLGGLAVAIPAAIFAHFFEGRITKMLSAVEYELRRLVPRFESLEGKTRYDISSRGMTRRPLADSPARRTVTDATAAQSPPLPTTAKA